MTWRTDMQNAPKDRPFLVYWRMSQIYGVVEWIDNHWEDQDGDEVMAFSNWSLFDLPPQSPAAGQAAPNPLNEKTAHPEGHADS